MKKKKQTEFSAYKKEQLNDLIFLSKKKNKSADESVIVIFTICETQGL